jgi:hypothetical protein
MAFPKAVNIQLVTADIDTPTWQRIVLSPGNRSGERDQGNQNKEPQCGYRRNNHSIAVIMRLMMMQVVIGK